MVYPPLALQEAKRVRLAAELISRREYSSGGGGGHALNFDDAMREQVDSFDARGSGAGRRRGGTPGRRPGRSSGRTPDRPPRTSGKAAKRENSVSPASASVNLASDYADKLAKLLDLMDKMRDFRARVVVMVANGGLGFA